jgi:hypothetical protein
MCRLHIAIITKRVQNAIRAVYQSDNHNAWGLFKEISVGEQTDTVRTRWVSCCLDNDHNACQVVCVQYSLR